MLVDVTVPLGALGIDPENGLPSRTAVEFERAVVAGDGVYVRITGDDAAVVTAFRESSHVERFERVVAGETDPIYRVVWTDPPPLFAAVTGVDGAVVAARASGENWTLTIRFPDRDAASQFVNRYDDDDLPVTIQQIHRASRLPTRELTAEQHAALRRAVDAGYFAVPRQATLGDLAEDLDISDTAVSQRLRRGLATVLPAVVDPTTDPVRANDD